VTDPLPVPLAGDTVIQLSFEEAVQAQPAVVVTDTAWVPPPETMAAEVGEAVKVQGVPLVIVKGLETVLRPEPFGPTAATRDSYTPPGSGHIETVLEKS
jgi:hypothetical protein